MSLAVLPDRSVLHTSRDGELRLTDAAGNTRVAGKLDVYAHDEEGLQGVGVDPDFTHNRFIYLYYAPPLNTPAGDAPETGTAADFAPFDGVNRLSRFVLNTDGTLDKASEKKILDVSTTRGLCCHVGGDIDFDADGNLYLSTGDDSNPFRSDGYSPLDERADRNPGFDAQRTAGNTNDLRGKILRIKVDADGSYSIPDGNLFAPGTARTRPEIYAMGFRNPFRFSVDKKTGIVYVGDYGPDAGAANPGRGPAGPGRVRPRDQGRQLRLAVLHRRQRPLRRLRLRDEDLRRHLRLLGAGERLPAQHRSHRPASGPARLDSVQRPLRTRVRRRLRVPDGRPGLPLRPRARLAREVPRGLRRRLLRR
ncbi:hypothetical protein GCM10017687_87840 [Streptomyces echinatus]